MPKCAQCGEDHELVDPIFRRPEAYVVLEDDQREAHARADDDLCRIDLPNASPRLFVRCVLPVAVSDRDTGASHGPGPYGGPGIAWGLWAEVDEADFARVLERWNDTDQANEPPFAATIANAVPGYDTCGLSAQVQLTGPTTRPDIVLSPASENTFARQCLAGIDQHLAHTWVRSMTAPSRGNPLDTTNLRAFVCEHVFTGADVLYAVHDHDGDWQFLCGAAHGGEQEQPRIIDVGHLTDRDASLRELGDRLQRGQQAERNDPQSPWRVL